jgi:hypothetical protein
MEAGGRLRLDDPREVDAAVPLQEDRVVCDQLFDLRLAQRLDAKYGEQGFKRGFEFVMLIAGHHANPPEIVQPPTLLLQYSRGL